MKKGQIQLGVLITIIFGSLAGLAGWNLTGFSENNKQHTTTASDIAVLKTQNQNFSNTIERIDRNMETLNQNFINLREGKPLQKLATTTAIR